MTEILVVKPRTLNAADKGALRKAGVIVVESSAPDDVRFIRATSDIPHSDLLLAAMKALKASPISSTDALFVKLVAEAVERQHTRAAALQEQK